MLAAFVIVLLMLVNQTALSAQSFNYLRNPSQRLTVSALRQIYEAEKTYASVFGNGNFASLEDLGTYELIDLVLGSGNKYGFEFLLETAPATERGSAAFSAVAIPAKFGFQTPAYKIDQTGQLSLITRFRPAERKFF